MWSEPPARITEPWSSRRHDLSGGDLEVGDQTLGAVTDIVLLAALDVSGNGLPGRMATLQGLHAGLLVATHQMNPPFMEVGCLLIQGADRARLVPKLFGVFGRCMLPITSQMGLKIDLILKNARPCGPKCWTRSRVSPPQRPPPAGSND